jgi:hypothetical protein
VIETRARLDHSRGTSAAWRNHVLLAPRADFPPNGYVIADLFERPRRKNDGNETAVLDDLDSAENSDIFQQAADVVLRIDCGYGFGHGTSIPSPAHRSPEVAGLAAWSPRRCNRE